MLPKKIQFLKYAIVLGLLLIALSIAISKADKAPPTPVEIITEDTLADPISIHESLRDSIVDFGMGFLGTPYVYGACGKNGFDCSGFVYYVFKNFNIKVPRSSIDFKNFGEDVAIEKVKKGDILLFLSPTRNVVGHVGMVINANGSESDFIHASSGGKMEVMISSLKQEHYKKRLVKAINVIDVKE